MDPASAEMQKQAPIRGRSCKRCAARAKGAAGRRGVAVTSRWHG
jgi:hypothetical protein